MIPLKLRHVVEIKGEAAPVRLHEAARKSSCAESPVTTAAKRAPISPSFASALRAITARRQKRPWKQSAPKVEKGIRSPDVIELTQQRIESPTGTGYRQSNHWTPANMSWFRGQVLRARLWTRSTILLSIPRRPKLVSRSDALPPQTTHEQLHWAARNRFKSLPLSSRPECSWACGPPKEMKIGAGITLSSRP